MNDTSFSVLESSDPQVENRSESPQAERGLTFAEWLRVAQPGEQYIYPGEQYIYYVGVGLGAASPEEEAEAKAALQTYADGVVELAQRRIGKNKFEYLAQKRRVTRAPTVFGEPWRTRL